MLFAISLLVASQTTPVYLDPRQPVEMRSADLVSRMTLAEKVSQMVHGAAAIPRLQVPAYNWWNEALHGVARNGTATVFPQPIGLAATFEPELIHQMGVATSDEARAKFHDQIRRTGSSGNYQGLTMWAPNINIFRDPRWGRGHETYGEDPFLTASMGVAYIKGMQGDDPKYLKTIATPKHFAVHSGPDPLRHQFDAKPSKRDLWNTYLPAFEACIKEGKADSIMSSYNRIDGAPASANTFLLEDTLRKKWGFKGYVVSDCGAINDIVSGHHYAKTYAEASADAVKAGCDLECGGAYRALVQAVNTGLIKEVEIDKSLKRLMEARIRLGLFDPAGSVPYSKIPMSVVDSLAHRKLALNLARKSMVLLKNDGILPFKKRIHSVAVVGPNIDTKETLWGNYNGTPTYTVTPLDGILNMKRVSVDYAEGCTITGTEAVQSVPAGAFVGLLKRELYRNRNLEGTPVVSQSNNINENWGEDGPEKGLVDNFSIRWTGKLKAPTAGSYTSWSISNLPGLLRANSYGRRRARRSSLPPSKPPITRMSSWPALVYRRRRRTKRVTGHRSRFPLSSSTSSRRSKRQASRSWLCSLTEDPSRRPGSMPTVRPYWSPGTADKRRVPPLRKPCLERTILPDVCRLRSTTQRVSCPTLPITI
jgi:beta-glucosidase